MEKILSTKAHGESAERASEKEAANITENTKRNGQKDTSVQELSDDFCAIGVSHRHVMIHSSYRVLKPVERGPAGVVEALVQAVDMGVLLVPAFNFTAFSEQGYFDRQQTPSAMGAISEAARVDKRFHRSSHPMLSFAVKGEWREPSFPSPAYTMDRRCGYLDDVPNGHGSLSVFDRIIRNDGLLLSFSGEGFREGKDVGFTASVHAFVEAGVDWRVMKLFRGVYVDGGVASIREYAASVTRDPSKHQTQVTPGHLEAERVGVIRRMKLGRAECLVASAREFHAFAVESCIKRPELWRVEL